jgi:hypothetical protein
MANLRTTGQEIASLCEKHFGVKSRHFSLQGTISHDKTWTNEWQGGGMYSVGNSYKLFVFSPKQGFIEITEQVCGEITNDGMSGAPYQTKKEVRLIDANFPNDALFLVEYNRNFDCTPSCGRDYDDHNWTIYKMPNFAQIAAKEKQADVERWVQWALKK